MQTYDGLVREAIAKMAELMVCDTEYRNTLLAQIKASHKQVREIAKNKNGNLGFYELMQYEGSLKGLNYCVGRLNQLLWCNRDKVSTHLFLAPGKYAA